MGWVSVALGVVLLLVATARSRNGADAQDQPQPGGHAESGAATALGLLGVLLILLGIPAIVFPGVAVAAATIMLTAGVVGLGAVCIAALVRAARRRPAGPGWFAPSAFGVLLITGLVGVTVTAAPPARQDAAGGAGAATHGTGPERRAASASPALRSASPKKPAAAASPSAPTAPTASAARRPQAIRPREAGPYPVLRVVDGDTLHVSIRGRDTTLRIIGIDTPETVDPRKPVECFGRAASNKAHQLLDGRVVYLTYDASQGRLDKYGRTLAYVSVGGTDYGRWMIRHGFAHEYTYDLPYRRQAAYRAAESQARRQDAGLWAPSTCAGDTGVDSGGARTGRASTAASADKDCSDFSTQAAAQQYFTAHGGSSTNNVDDLDADHDGVACETLPGGSTSSGGGSTGPGGGSTGSGGTDPRFPTCSAAIAAGYGPYVRGRDPEYGWYRDADDDGVVCEP